MQKCKSAEISEKGMRQKRKGQEVGGKREKAKKWEAKQKS